MRVPQKNTPATTLHPPAAGAGQVTAHSCEVVLGCLSPASTHPGPWGFGSDSGHWAQPSLSSLLNTSILQTPRAGHQQEEAAQVPGKTPLLQKGQEGRRGAEAAGAWASGAPPMCNQRDAARVAPTLPGSSCLPWNTCSQIYCTTDVSQMHAFYHTTPIPSLINSTDFSLITKMFCFVF